MYIWCISETWHRSLQGSGMFPIIKQGDEIIQYARACHVHAIGVKSVLQHTMLPFEASLQCTRRGHSKPRCSARILQCQSILSRGKGEGAPPLMPVP